MFVVLLLVYVAIMATRAQRLERELNELQRDVEAMRAGELDRPRQSPDADAPAPTGSVL